MANLGPQPQRAEDLGKASYVISSWKKLLSGLSNGWKSGLRAANNDAQTQGGQKRS